LTGADLLDEFSSAKIDQKPDAPTSSGPGRPDPFPTGKADDDLAEEFNKQLQAQMASLMGEIDESPEMRRQLAEMMNELTTDAGAQLEADDKVGGGSKGVAGAPANPDEAFQDTIRKTMERMQASGDRATAAAADESEDMLATMLKELQGEGGGSEEDISKMLLGMMEQLTNKDILYEPMKELNDKFPAWMEKNKATTAADDLARYVEQQHLVGEIVGRFERKQYSDDNAADREFIVERMQKVRRRHEGRFDYTNVA
jgi:peroxin-19